LPIEVHAGRSELLQEYVDLAVEPRTSRHVASLPSSRHGARSNIRTATDGNPAVLARYRHWPFRCCSSPEAWAAAMAVDEVYGIEPDAGWDADEEYERVR
jgi:hypothetical protein